MSMDETIHVSSIIDKLSLSWKDFKHMLKHKKEEISLVEFGSHLCIEEGLRLQEKEKEKETLGSSVVNMMEEGSQKGNYNKGKKRPYNSTNGSNKKPKGTRCWNYRKAGHFKKDCRVGKGKKGNTLNQAAQGSKDQGLIKDDEIVWWVDLGATTHISRDKSMFKSFVALDDGRVLRMGNESTDPILGKCEVELEFSFGKTFIMKSVLYVPRIQ